MTYVRARLFSDRTTPGCSRDGALGWHSLKRPRPSRRIAFAWAALLSSRNASACTLTASSHCSHPSKVSGSCVDMRAEEQVLLEGKRKKKAQRSIGENFSHQRD